jgi:hypothetical protein
MVASRLVSITKLWGFTDHGVVMAHVEPYSGSGFAIELSDTPPRPEPSPKSKMSPEEITRRRAQGAERAIAILGQIREQNRPGRPLAETEPPKAPKEFFHDLRKDHPQGEAEKKATYARRLHGLWQDGHKNGRVTNLWKWTTILRDLNRP